MEITWIFIAVLFGVAETMTSQLISIWFVGGSLAAIIASLLGFGMVVQFSVFVVISALLLLCTRKFVRKFTQKGFSSTNLDAKLGKEIIITKRVDNLRETGEASLNGISWTVRSINDEIIEAGETALIERIEGVKLMVRKNG